MLIGPVLVRPYTQTDQASGRSQELTATTFPRELDVHGTLIPSERRRGLYKVPVYELQGNLKGKLNVVDPLGADHVDLSSLGAAQQSKVVWGEPYLALSVADVRGIIGTPKVLVNGVAETMLQGAPSTQGWQPNLRIPLRGMTALKGELDFTVEMTLAGTETFGVAPVGDSNHLEIRSTWSSPLFGWQFLPRTREVDPSGFQAAWNVSSLASGTQVQMEGNPVKAIDMMNVSLRTMVNPYTLSSRAVKYGILFVVLTFGGFLLFELMKQLPIHPVQYLLVGFGLAIFFFCWLAFRNIWRFCSLIYLRASLVSGYLRFIFRLCCEAGNGE